jgi:hypothetical protein
MAVECCGEDCRGSGFEDVLNAGEIARFREMGQAVAEPAAPDLPFGDSGPFDESSVPADDGQTFVDETESHRDMVQQIADLKVFRRRTPRRG